MKPWLDPGEDVRAAVLAHRLAFPTPWTRRVIVATDSHVYVMKRGIPEKDLIAELLEKHEIETLDIRPGVFGGPWYGGLLQGVRIASKGYGPTSLGGIRDMRNLYWFILNKQPD